MLAFGAPPGTPDTMTNGVWDTPPPYPYPKRAGTLFGPTRGPQGVPPLTPTPTLPGPRSGGSPRVAPPPAYRPGPSPISPWANWQPQLGQAPTGARFRGPTFTATPWQTGMLNRIHRGFGTASSTTGGPPAPAASAPPAGALSPIDQITQILQNMGWFGG